MSILKVSETYRTDCGLKKAKQHIQVQRYEADVLQEREHIAEKRSVAVQDIYKMMKNDRKRFLTEEAAEKEEVQEKHSSTQAEEEESETKSEIIVKPDGSRVLVVTMQVGGMETTMSLEISKPTAMQNDCSMPDEEAGALASAEIVTSTEISEKA